MMISLVSDSELSEMKSTLRALRKKRDKVSVEIAEKLGITGSYVISQLNLNDPRVTHLRDELYRLESKIDELFWEIEEAEAIQNNEHDRYLARKKCTEFLGALGDKAANEFLIQNHLTTITLVEEVLKNPNFLKEKYTQGPNNSWLPIIRIEDNMVFVKTIRGVEPARKANAKCEEVKVGDLALCKSVRNHLFMIDYTHQGVEA
ncbi:hypothetical protein [Methanobrevibacter sp.]|uniref:hypothetical protein n=1 Tax=Methanobrevibacter sp. TaxID=66852 RepID=UPI0025E8FE38|nr:hypothetical protein [Methanobrevibacter sp.]MBQ6512234.1 hypothetical protein [Methanobrevibacter sp.]